MHEPALSALVLADFNAANFAARLTRDTAAPRLVARAHAWDLRAQAPTGDDAVTIVWTRPEAISPAFRRLCDEGTSDIRAILEDVDCFADQVDALRGRSARLVVCTWAVPPLVQAFSGHAMRNGIGLANAVLRMNLRLAERLDDGPDVTLLDAATWIGPVRTPEEAKLWYAAKIPFRHEVFKYATERVKAVVRAARGQASKVIVLDLDDTMWGGIVGDVGWPALRLGGHDPIGEAYVDFQRTLLALSRRGVLLAVASKNEESVASRSRRSIPILRWSSARATSRRGASTGPTRRPTFVSWPPSSTSALSHSSSSMTTRLSGAVSVKRFLRCSSRTGPPAACSSSTR
jgi:hypothetical protein